jgi:recombinational DNA repair protein (RecF pathway)
MPSLTCFGTGISVPSTAAEPKELFFGIREDLVSLSYASYFCELAMTCIPAEEPSRKSCG